MSRYIGPKLKLIKKLGPLSSWTSKFVKKKKESSSIIFSHQKHKLSEYSLRLKEKQKLKFYYNVTEKQLFNYFKRAKSGPGIVNISFIEMLEMRLDNIIFRSGLCPTIVSARQLINHKHIFVNKKLVSFSNFSCRAGDLIKLNNNFCNKNRNKEFFRFNNNVINSRFLSVNKRLLEILITKKMMKDDSIFNINELLVIEHLSRRC
uniref:Small ribosomal subunit protein uS4c n=1 Tax=Pterocladiophila hemisphaerica TaxID=2712948 RepID=A0A6M3WWA5_9FLOR|nr:ribosomal protein S4 [Pterocladiophila hemisphaerica]